MTDIYVGKAPAQSRTLPDSWKDHILLYLAYFILLLMFGGNLLAPAACFLKFDQPALGAVWAAVDIAVILYGHRRSKR